METPLSTEGWEVSECALLAECCALRIPIGKSKEENVKLDSDQLGSHDPPTHIGLTMSGNHLSVLEQQSAVPRNSMGNVLQDLLGIQQAPVSFKYHRGLPNTTVRASSGLLSYLFHADLLCSLFICNVFRYALSLTFPSWAGLSSINLWGRRLVLRDSMVAQC